MLAVMQLNMAKEKCKHADWSHFKILTPNLKRVLNAGQESCHITLAICSHCCLDDYFTHLSLSSKIQNLLPYFHSQLMILFPLH